MRSERVDEVPRKLDSETLRRAVEHRIEKGVSEKSKPFIGWQVTTELQRNETTHTCVRMRWKSIALKLKFMKVKEFMRIHMNSLLLWEFIRISSYIKLHIHSASKLREHYNFPKIVVIFKWLYLCEKWSQKIFKKRILKLEVSSFWIKYSIFFLRPLWYCFIKMKRRKQSFRNFCHVWTYVRAEKFFSR